MEGIVLCSNAVLELEEGMFEDRGFGESYLQAVLASLGRKEIACSRSFRAFQHFWQRS